MGLSCEKWGQLVVKGFLQIPGIDFDETFSPVAHFETVRLLLAVSALEDWEIKVLDVKTAFLYGSLDEELYMEQPELRRFHCQSVIPSSDSYWVSLIRMTHMTHYILYKPFKCSR